MNFKPVLILVIVGLSKLCLGQTAEETKARYRTLPRVNFSLANSYKNDIIYTLFTDESPTNGVVITEATADSMIKKKTIPTALFLHGWTTDDTSPWYKPLRDEYFKTGPHNIIFLNWSKAGNKSYAVSSANVKPVGNYIGQFLVASKVDLSKVHVVGHSLGSHVASYIGKSIIDLTGRKVGRITALDPAGPMFTNSDVLAKERLNSDDAEFVDVIHTDIQINGFTAPIGHVDFYPNGGKHQPGCPSYEEDSLCSHDRSTLYFVESVTTKVLTKEVTFIEDKKFVVSLPLKENGKEAIFGEHVDPNTRGVYYLKTNLTQPFLEAKK